MTLITPGGALRGVAAGLVATVAMSTFMVAAERAGMMPGLPPRRIVDRFAPGLGEPAADVATVVSHAGYGAVAGAAFGSVAAGRRWVVPAGTAFGVLLWASGYEGWVPLANVLPPAHRDHRGRVITMVSAHLVYGSVLGALLRRA